MSKSTPKKNAKKSIQSDSPRKYGASKSASPHASLPNYADQKGVNTRRRTTTSILKSVRSTTSVAPDRRNPEDLSAESVWEKFHTRINVKPSATILTETVRENDSDDDDFTIDRNELFAIPPPVRVLNNPTTSVIKAVSAPQLGKPEDTARDEEPGSHWQETFLSLSEKANKIFRHRKVYIYNDDQDSVSPDDSDSDEEIDEDPKIDAACQLGLKQFATPQGSRSYPFLCKDQAQFHKLRVDLLNKEVRVKDRGPASDFDLNHNLHLKMTPSGRELDGGGDAPGKETCMFKRVKYLDDEEFDILEPAIDLGPENGEWPNPFTSYWNWKKLDKDEGVDDHYLLPPANPIHAAKRQRAEELESNPMKIPYCQFKEADLESSDTENELNEYVKNKTKIQLRALIRRGRVIRKSQVRRSITDPVIRRYGYLRLNLKGRLRRRLYQLKKIYQAYKRRGHKIFLQIRKCFCRNTRYPLWFRLRRWFWRPIWKHIPRKWKLLRKRNTKTIFYGTMASILGTQYISEHDVMPNMDDPVLMSQIALIKAMEIKEKFLYKGNRGHQYVDYIALQRSEDYEKYVETIGMLCRYQPMKMSPTVRKVFFLNYFNVLSIHSQILRIPEVENMKYLCEMPYFWEKTKGLCGYVELSLQDIYHGILRCNQIHGKKRSKVFKESTNTKDFAKELNRTRLSLDWLDPRIHFALSVGCKGCPPIQVFSLFEHDCQLDQVAVDYVQSKVKVNFKSRLVILPILFLWYEKDFGNNQRIMLFYLRRFMKAKDALKIRKLIVTPQKISFRYVRFDDQLDPIVRRHPRLNCTDDTFHKSYVPRLSCVAKF